MRMLKTNQSKWRKNARTSVECSLERQIQLRDQTRDMKARKTAVNCVQNELNEFTLNPGTLQQAETPVIKPDHIPLIVEQVILTKEVAE